MGCSSSTPAHKSGAEASSSGTSSGKAVDGEGGDGAPSERVLDARKLHYDHHGNIRCGTDSHDRELELHQMFAADDPYLQQSNKTWYVVDASWLASWLAFVHYEKSVSPAPGPCRNDRLLVPNFEARRFEPRHGLVLSLNRVSGHYKLMSGAAWALIQHCYPGSGPEIRTSASFRSDDPHAADGLYDTSQWEIDQSGFEAVEKEAIASGLITAVAAATATHGHNRPSSSRLDDYAPDHEDAVDSNRRYKQGGNTYAGVVSDGMEDQKVSDEDILKLLRFIGGSKAIIDTTVGTASSKDKGTVIREEKSTEPASTATATTGAGAADSSAAHSKGKPVFHPVTSKFVHYQSPEVWLFGAQQ